MLTLLKSLVIPMLEYCSQLWNSWKTKDIQSIKGIQRTFTYKITEVQHLKNWERLHELKLYSFQRFRERYVIIYIWKIAYYGAKYWWHNGAQNKNQKTSKTWNTLRYSVSNKQKPSTIPSRKCNNCIWVSIVQLVARISERHRKCENWKIQIWTQQIPGAHSWLAKNANYVTASGNNSILNHLTHLRAIGIYQSGGLRLGHGAVLAASKPLQVAKYPSIIPKRINIKIKVAQWSQTLRPNIG